MAEDRDDIPKNGEQPRSNKPGTVANPGGAGRPNPLIWLIAGILGLLCCGFPFAAVGIVFAAYAMSALAANDVPRAIRHNKLAMVFSLIGFIITWGVGFLYFLYLLFGTVIAPLLPFPLPEV